MLEYKDIEDWIKFPFVLLFMLGITLFAMFAFDPEALQQNLE